MHYGPLDVEDLGRVYEALLELEPGITSEPMARRRAKLEVVLPSHRASRYRMTRPASDDHEGKTHLAWVEDVFSQALSSGRNGSQGERVLATRRARVRSIPGARNTGAAHSTPKS